MKIVILGHQYGTGSRLAASMAVAVGMSLASVVPAVADDGNADVFDASGLVQQITPGLLEETVPLQDAAAQVEEPSNDTALKLIVDSAASASSAVKEDANTSPSPALSIQPSYATKKVGESAGLSIWNTTSEDVAAYVQPMDTGVRVFTAIASQDAPTSYDYDLDVPEGTTLKQNAIGYMILAPTGDSLGQILSPWAKDANGVDLPTAYTWENGKLTQTVDLSNPRITFPVLMDPAWSYTHTVDIPTKTPAQIRSKLLNCFNCYFPVEGAPRAFPSDNQYLPLRVGPVEGGPSLWDFSCIMQTTHYATFGNKSWFGWSFRASGSHVDGAGSTIAFDFNPRWPQGNPDAVSSQLVVSARIMNDNPVGTGQGSYTLMARGNWNFFASKLIYG